MSKIRTAIKRILLSLVTLSVLGAVGLTWYGSGVLINKPIAERHDFCTGEAKFCTSQLLSKLNMVKLEIPVELTSFDGTPLRGSYFPSKNGAAVIVQHGYGGHRGTVLHIASMLHNHGFSVITMDLRGHGESGGEIVTFGRDESKDMQVVFDYLSQRSEVNPEKIGIYGWSLGGATVLLHGAMNPDVKAVAADSPFDAINYENMAEFSDTIWPLPMLLKFFSSIRADVDFETEAPIAHLDAYKTKPLFLMLAGSDTVVDPKSGDRLLKKLNNKNVKVWKEPSFGHVRFSFDAAERFERELVQFFATHLKPTQSN
jgi:uncharacterized protein